MLVAYGSRRGGTEGLARAVAEGLTDAGHSVDIRPARDLDSLDRWDAVVLGGALYAWHWHRDARRFARHHLEALRQRPVYFFSSGPLDGSAAERELPPPKAIARLLALVQARAHRTFGGRLLPGDRSPVPMRGDWRDLPAARAWGRGLGAELHALPLPPFVAVPASLPAWHRLVLGLCAFTALTAVLGGLSLMTARPGSPAVPPLALLEHTPFDSFFVPGLVLLVVVGGANLLAAVLEARRARRSELAVALAGAVLTGWIVAQLALLRVFSWLQLVYLLVGLVTLTGAAWLWRQRHRLGTRWRLE